MTWPIGVHCSVHQEAKLKIIWGTAPFRAEDSEVRKTAWLDRYKERIKVNYEDKKERKVVSMRSVVFQY